MKSAAAGDPDDDAHIVWEKKVIPMFEPPTDRHRRQQRGRRVFFLDPAKEPAMRAARPKVGQPRRQLLLNWSEPAL